MAGLNIVLNFIFIPFLHNIGRCTFQINFANNIFLIIYRSSQKVYKIPTKLINY